MSLAKINCEELKGMQPIVAAAIAGGRLARLQQEW